MAMTDPGREVPLAVGDQTYTLYAGLRALRVIERETGQSFFEVAGKLTEPEKFSFIDLSAILLALLGQHHPAATMDDVDAIFDTAGYAASVEAIGAAMERAFPEFSGDDAGKAMAPNGAAPGPGTKRSRAPSPRA